MSDLTGTKGGSGVWQRIISEMPAHRVYVEAFWGRGTLATIKRPAECTIGLDLDPAAITSGNDFGALMFLADARRWLKDYFRLSRSPDAESYVARAAAGIATFAGAAVSDHFVYLDPPYLGCSGYYKHELTEAEHRDLCRVFLALPCPAALSGYHSAAYAEELSGAARLIEIPTVNRAGRKVTECLWLNFDPPARYHDVRFVGSGRRERERIRRRVRNWRDGLARLPIAERQAVLEALLGTSARRLR